MNDTIKLGNVRIPITDFASQGNAVLGIRDSGKSYSATYLAERLLDAGIPFVAFDPIGIWKYLRVAGKGKGYPVVVASVENGDLPLTVRSAPEIVRAAMQQGVSLVIDLYDMSMSKAEWKTIVEQCIRILLYENKKYGLRHVFIEEATEFVPQRIGPDQGRVYAEIEKLARMGGNALLGYTLINQRAEEINKAVLELCDRLFLHRQKGKNSLISLGKWMDVGSQSETKPIVQSLPMLGPGIPSKPVFAEIYEYGKPPHLAVVVFWRSVAPNQPGKWYLSPWFYGLEGPFMEVPVRQWTEMPVPPILKQGELFGSGGAGVQNEAPNL